MARGPVVEELAGVHAPRIDGLVLAAHEQRLDLDLADPAADPADLVLRAADLARAHPLHEHLTAQLMTALRRHGRPAEALTAYDELRRRLAEELGTDPSPELQQLHLQLLQDAPEPVEPRPARRRTNLRAGLTSFLGRDEEEKRLHRLLETGRLATIVGPGGAGKTRLAGHVAADWVDRMPDGVWFVELAPVTDANAVAQAFLSAVGIQAREVLESRQERVPVATADKLVDELAERRCLLVVDNCEHLIGPVAELVEDLLAACPGLRVLATSREPLGADGEALCLLPPLLLPRHGADVETALAHASVLLFADRARAADADFVVDETTVADVVEIVRRLDGLPLAIELAAARLRVLPVHEIAARLGDRFRLLSGGRRTAMPRHRTLKAVVEWSWDLLSDDERLLAERLAVFPAGTTVEGAAAVVETAGLDTADVEDLLDALVDKSLLRLDGADGLRYRMLETIREYGTERLVAAGVVDEVRRAHALHHAAFLAEAEGHLRTADQLVWLRRLEAELGNILAALQYLVATRDMDVAVPLATSLGFYWTLVGNHAEVATWLASTLAVPGGSEQDRLVADAVLAVNALAGPMADDGDPAHSRSHVALLADVATRIDAVGLDGSNQSLVMLRPMMSFFGGDEDEVRRLIDRSLAVADRWTAAALVMFRGNLAENGGDIEGMRRDMTTALAAFEELGERWGMASCLASLGLLAVLDGDLTGALARIEAAIGYLEDFGAVGDLVFLRARLVQVRLRLGDVAGAEGEWDSLSAVASSRHLRLVVDTTEAAIRRAQGDAVGARRVRERVLSDLVEIGEVHPLNGHLRAMALSTVVGIDLWLDPGPVDPSRLVDMHDTAVATRDMPIVATTGPATAGGVARLGLPEVAARMLGAASAVQGRFDATDPETVTLVGRLRGELGDARFEEAFAAGRALPRAEAVAALDPRPYVAAVAVTTP